MKSRLLLIKFFLVGLKTGVAEPRMVGECNLIVFNVYQYLVFACGMSMRCGGGRTNAHCVLKGHFVLALPCPETRTPKKAIALAPPPIDTLLAYTQSA